ncbi:hypothetical protein C8F04DRAFT_1255637 [Mycena alexandri]|uniref:Uncharacterized protein n=1 Tax=Mycena alexandri TaxID=1745969 RepID=A0AAD6T3P0_9AGAR|nr:hypothetical protein C8F04DRAFT_1255637 [Mycena alexandri]
MAQTDGGWCTVSVHDVGADMLGRVLSAHDGAGRRRMGEWCLRKTAAQAVVGRTVPAQDGGADTRFSGLQLRGPHYSVSTVCGFALQMPSTGFALVEVVPMCSSQYRASPPYTAVSPSRAFVFSTADSRMTMDLPSMRSSGSHTYPPYTAVSPYRAFVFGAADPDDGILSHAAGRLALGGDRLRETMAQTGGSSVPAYDGGADRGGEWCLRKTAAQAGEANGVCARWRRRHTWLGERCLRKMAAQARDSADCFEVPTVLHCSVSTLCGFALQMPSTGFALVEHPRRTPGYTVHQLIWPNCSSGSRTFPSCTGSSPFRTFETVGAQYLRWGGERCLRKMAAQAHMVGRTVPAQDGGAGTRFSGLVLAREQLRGPHCYVSVVCGFALQMPSTGFALVEHPRRTPGYTVHQLIWPNCSSGSRTFPSCTGSSPFRTLETVGAQYLHTTGAQTGEMAAQAHMVGRTVPAQDGGAGTRFSGLVLAREAAQTSPSSDSRLHSSPINLAQLLLRLPHISFVHRPTCQKYVFLTVPCIYPPCTSGSSSPAFLGGTDRGTYAKKLNFYSASSFECDFVS